MAEKFFVESVEHVATMSNLIKCSICSKIGAKPWAKSQFNLSLAKLSPTLFLYITGFYNPLEKPRKNMITISRLLCVLNDLLQFNHCFTSIKSRINT